MKKSETKEKEKKFKIHYITTIFIVFLVNAVIFGTVGIVKMVSKIPIEDIRHLKTQVDEVSDTKEYVMPKLYIEGDIFSLKTKSEKAETRCTFSATNKTFITYATVKLQGSSSLFYDKKNYTITFFDDEEYDKKRKIDLGYGWGEQSKYCFKANWIDSTHARNIVSARIAASVQEQYGLFQNTPNNGVIDGYPIEIYVNDEYLGLYTCNIPKDAWMFNMDKDNENHLVFCGENNNPGSSSSFERLADIDGDPDWSIEVGPEDDIEKINEAYEKLNRVIAFVKDSSDEEFVAHFDEYLNKDACLNYLAFMWLSNGIDSNAKNLLLVTYDGQVWYPSLYDLDSTWGLYWDGSKILPPTYVYPDDYQNTTSVLFKRILDCFTEDFKARYTELRKGVLSNQEIMNEFTKFENLISEEAWEREHTKWPGVPSKDFGMEQITEFIKSRAAYVDKEVKNLKPKEM